MFKGKKTILIRLAAVAAVLLAAAAGMIYIADKYRVKEVYVEGNVHYTTDEIKDIVMSDRFGDNSLYLSMKYKNKDITDIPFVDVLNVNILSPDTIKITVYEKALAGYIRFMDTYMYFDKDGYVVESSQIKTNGIPQITGLSFDHVVRGEQIPVEDPAIFESILGTTKLLNKYSLTADKINFRKDGTMVLYFETVKVDLGIFDNTLEDKIMLLPAFLPELYGKKGTLQMQNIDENAGKYTFKPDLEQ